MNIDAEDTGTDTVKTLHVIKYELGKMAGRFDAMDGRLDAMDGRFDAMDGRLDAMDGRLDAMDGKLGAMERDIAQILIILQNPSSNISTHTEWAKEN